MIRKHSFANSTNPEPLAPNWLGRKCFYCNKISGLDDWQIRDMPKDMAKCSVSKKRSSLWEYITGCYDCLIKKGSEDGKEA